MSVKNLKNILAFCSALLLLACFSTECLAFAEPVLRKANEATGHLLSIVRGLVLLIGAVILIAALSGRVNWKWIGVVCCVALLSGPGWGPITTFLGVGDNGLLDNVGQHIPNLNLGRR